MLSKLVWLLGQIPSPLLGVLVVAVALLLIGLTIVIVAVPVSEVACGRIIRVLNAVAKLIGKNNRGGKRK